MNQEIAITVRNKIAETDFSEVVSFNSIYRLKFSLDAEWDEFPSRVAVVLWAGGAAEKLFTGTECEMPQISSMDADTALVGIYSRIGERRIASSFVQLRCEAGAGGFPQPKPSLSLHEQVLSFLNQKDWEIFNDKVAEGVYSCVRVNKKGLVTEGKKIIEVGQEGSSPSGDLAAGGIFFRLKDGLYTPCYFDGSSLRELTVSAKNLGHTLTLGSATFDGTEDVNVPLGRLATQDYVLKGNIVSGTVGTSEIGEHTIIRAHLNKNIIAEEHLSKDCVSELKIQDGAVTDVKLAEGAVTAEKIAEGAVAGKNLAEGAVKAGEHISVSRDEENNVVVSSDVTATVYSVNGKSGDVTLDRETLGLAKVAYSGSFADLIGAPETGVNSVNGQTGNVVVDRHTLGLADIALSGSYNDLVDAPETGVFSVNGETGFVTLTADTLGLAEVASSGSYNDLTDRPPQLVNSVNGETGAVTLDAQKLGLGKLATQDYVLAGNIVSGTVGTSEIGEHTIIRAHLNRNIIAEEHLSKDCVTELKIQDGAVTGMKLAEGAIVGGDNISVTRDEDSNFVISASPAAIRAGALAVSPVPACEERAGADFDSLLCGKFLVTGTAENPCENFPVSEQNPSGGDCLWGVFALSAQDGAVCIQTAISARGDGAFLIRTHSGGVWSPWRKPA